MPSISRLLGELRSRRVGYARLDPELVIRDVGGCTDLWGDVRGELLTTPLPELLGMSATIVDSISSGQEISLPLITRERSDAIEYLDVVIQPDPCVPGGAVAWLFDMTDLGRLAHAYARAMSDFRHGTEATDEG